MKFELKEYLLIQKRIIVENPNAFFGGKNLQIPEQEQKSGSNGTDEGTRAGASGDGANRAIVAEVEVRGPEGKKAKIGEVEEFTQFRWRGIGNRRGSTITDDPITERLSGSEIRGWLRTGKESQHPRTKVQGTKSRSRSRRRRKRRRCP